jgi:hypothetical protein
VVNGVSSRYGKGSTKDDRVPYQGHVYLACPVGSDIRRSLMGPTKWICRVSLTRRFGTLTTTLLLKKKRNNAHLAWCILLIVSNGLYLYPRSRHMFITSEENNKQINKQTDKEDKESADKCPSRAHD